MGKVITVAIQKGGCGKSITSGTLAYLLSEQGYKTLLVDLDGQGNSTELLTMTPVREFRLNEDDPETGALAAIKTGEPENYILALNDNLHILPACEIMGSLTQWLFTEYKGSKIGVIKRAIDQVRDKYDYIIIDTAPALDFVLTNALTASDGVVIMYETSKFCHSALASFKETVEQIQELTNPNLKVIGILAAMLDMRRADNKEYLEKVRAENVDVVFDTVIQRAAATGRLPIAGFFHNPEVGAAVKQYKPFVQELINRGC